MPNTANHEMSPELEERLRAEVQRGGQAYIMNLAAAEAAVLRGQFNVAKVLRAAAHTQRALAIGAARQLAGQVNPMDVLANILRDIEHGSSVDSFQAIQQADEMIANEIAYTDRVREHLKVILRRALASLEVHSDVSEQDVAQSLWGCYRCGNLVEGSRPDVCDVCGALGVEFEWFGPFYSSTAEHLGQLTPTEVIAILRTVPEQLADAISTVEEAVLNQKPSEADWSAKEIVGHMLETDLLFARRLQTLVTEQKVPDLSSPIPPWKLQEGKGYERLSAAELLERFADVRTRTLAAIQELSPEQWGRAGTVRGDATTLLDLGSWLANHDRGHLRQVQRLCRDEKLE